jgi:hypothetical protein
LTAKTNKLGLKPPIEKWRKSGQRCIHEREAAVAKTIDVRSRDKEV